MRNLLKQINNIFHGWFYYIFGKNQDLYDRRIKVCNTCPMNSKNLYSDSGIEHCVICSCPLQPKLRVPDEECPNNLWEKKS